MLKNLMAAVSLIALTGPALAQQPAQSPDQMQSQIDDMSIQLELTRQQLTEANKNFVDGRSSTIRLGRQLNQAQSDLAKAMSESTKKDDQIRDLKANLDTAQKALKATVRSPEAMPVPPTPAPAINAGPARP